LRIAGTGLRQNNDELLFVIGVFLVATKKEALIYQSLFFLSLLA
jgi:hypothetical protein